jgi:plastocyanin
VVIEINSGAADVAQPIHVHAGSCETLGGVDYALDSVLNGFSSTIIDVSLPALREGLSAINLHKSGAEVGTYVACGNIPAAGTTVTISLNPLNDSGQAGAATLIAAGDTTWVVVNVGTGPLGVSQPIHIHSGSCADLGGVETGLTTLENGRSITMIDSPIASFLAGDRAVNLHKSGPEASLYTSCGDLPITTVSASAGVSSDAVTLIMGELNDSGQSGSVTLTPKGTKTTVAVSITPGAVGNAQPSHVHAGSCDTLGGVEYPLTSLDAGMSSTTIDISISSLLSGRFAVNAHKSGSEASVFVACGDIPKRADVLTIALGELNSSGQSGTATLVANGDSTDVAVIVTPGAAGVAQPIHIHASSCATLGGVEYPLTAVMDGTSLTSVGVTLQSLRDGDFAVNLHKSGAEASVYHACGDIGEGAAAVAVSDDSGGSGDSTPPPDIQSKIVNFALEDLEISVGQTVIWENTDNAPHTVTHRVTDSSPPAVDSEFRSSTLTQSGQYYHVFDTPGTFQYFCEIHPNMRATITVS